MRIRRSHAPTNDPRRVGRRLLLAIAPLLLVLEVPGAYELLHRPDPGFKLQSDVVRLVDPEGPAAHAGVEAGDQIVALESLPVSGHADLLCALAAHAGHDSLRLSLRRDGEHVEVTMDARSPTGGRAYDLLMSVSALAFLFLGFSTYLRRDDELGRTFHVTCVLLAYPLLDLPTIPEPWAMRMLEGIRDAVQLLMPAMLLRFLMIFPDGPTSAASYTRQRWVLVPAALLAPLHLAGALWIHRPEVSRGLDVLLVATALLFVLYVLAAIGVFAAKILRPKPWQLRTKLRLALMGLIVGVLPITASTIAVGIGGTGSAVWTELSVLALPLVPASFSVALLRSGAIDLAYLVRQSLIALFLTVPLLLAAWGLTGLLQPDLSARWRTAVYFGVLVLIPLASVLMRTPARTVARVIDRALYPEQRRVRKAAGMLGQRLSEQNSPVAVLSLLLDGVLDLVGAVHGSVFELEGEKWVCTSGRPVPALDRSCGLAREIVETKDMIPLDSRDTRKSRGPWRYRRDPASARWIHETGTQVVAPLVVSGEAIAWLALGPRREGRDYGALHLFHTSAVCRQAAAALENARLREEDLARERLRTELVLAREIQQRLLPQEPLVRGDVVVTGHTESCRAVGGDLFDYFTLSDGSMVLVVSDAAGKGIPASLLTSGLRTAMRETVRPGLPLERAIAHVNRHVHGMTRDGHFIAAFVGVLQPNDGMLEFCVAGIEPPLWMRTDLGRTEWLSRGGPVLGIDPDARYRVGTVRLAPGDTLLAYSDGVIDEEDAEGTEYGRERFVRESMVRRELAPKEVLDGILADVTTYSNGESVDDTTLMVVRRFRSAAMGTNHAVV